MLGEALAETSPWRLKPRQEWFLAGARGLAAPEPGGHHIYVGDGEFTARLDVSSGREQQQFLLEDLAVASTATPGSRPGYLATTKRLYECRAGGRPLIPRFDLPPRTRALAIGPEGKHAFAATERSLCCFSIDGRQHWFREVMNYLLPAQLLVWNHDRLFISSGPHAPRLHVFDFEGDLLREIDLQRPILAMLKVAPDLSEILIVESGFADKLPARLRRINEDGTWEPPRDLAEGIYQTRRHGNCLSLFGKGGHLRVINTNGETLLEHTEPGEIVDAAWQPESRYFSVIIRHGNRTLIRAYEARRSEGKA
jgi:hypothetical protein